MRRCRVHASILISHGDLPDDRFSRHGPGGRYVGYPSSGLPGDHRGEESRLSTPMISGWPAAMEPGCGG